MSWASMVGSKTLTPEQLEQNRQREEARRAHEAEALKRSEARKLADLVESCIYGRDAGVSSKYAGDEQYEVKGAYTAEIVNLAFTDWKARYTPEEQVNLGIHRVGPSKKWSGDRNGKCQVNFIRKIVAAKAHRYNIHINCSDGCGS